MTHRVFKEHVCEQNSPIQANSHSIPAVVIDLTSESDDSFQSNIIDLTDD
jgi:hypothetical protein